MIRRNWWWHGAKIAVFGGVALALLGAVVMFLWNELLPGLFGWPVLGFWQALGLLLLSRLLLGGWRGGGARHGHWRGRMRERWEQMSDEERATFRAGLRRGCGRRAAPPADIDAAGASAPR